jgi:hypothetical protein
VTGLHFLEGSFGRKLASCGGDGRLRIWNTRDWSNTVGGRAPPCPPGPLAPPPPRAAKCSPLRHDSTVSPVSCIVHGSILLHTHTPQNVHISTVVEEGGSSKLSSMASMAVSTHDSIVYFPGADGTISGFHSTSGKRVSHYPGHLGGGYPCWGWGCLGDAACLACAVTLATGTDRAAGSLLLYVCQARLQLRHAWLPRSSFRAALTKRSCGTRRRFPLEYQQPRGRCSVVATGMISTRTMNARSLQASHAFTQGKKAHTVHGGRG